MENMATPQRNKWDPLVKLTHWGVALAVAANALLVAEGSGIHIWIGYALGGLLVLRWLWGLIGPAEARFSAFPPSPMRAVRHLRAIGRGVVSVHRSHNPLGALMVYALWACLAVIVASGIAMAGPPPADPLTVRGEAEHSAPARIAAKASPEALEEAEEDDEGAGEEGAGGEGEEMWEEVHEAAVNLLYVLIALHIAGVLFETRRSGLQVVRAMLPGRMRER